MNGSLKMKINLFTILFVSLLCLFNLFSNAQNNTTFQVGVILDLDSLVGRIGLTSLLLAQSDFYTLNANYSTRLELHVKDSGGRVIGAAATALNLLKDVKVDAIIGPQKSAHANFVIDLADAAQVPVVSFSATSPSLNPRSPYFVQTAVSDADQANAIAAIVKNFRWSRVVFVYEDSDYGHGIIPYLPNALQEVNARVSYRSVIPVSASDDLILRELYKMKTMQTRVFVVHIASRLASRFFPKVKEAEMMSQDYAWIVTGGLTDLFHSLGSHVVESMQGVLGVKPLIPESRALKSTSIKWKQKFLHDYGISEPEMNLFGVWAYDTMWALAMAAERVGVRQPSSSPNASDSNSTNIFATDISLTGPKLLQALLETTFQGLSGNFRLIDKQLEPSSFQILNVVGNELKGVGIWTPSMQISNRLSSSTLLKGVTWPGGVSATPPKGWEIPVSGKKLKVAVPAEAGFPEFVKVERDPETNATKFSGYYIDLFEAIISALPYAVRYEFVPFDTANSSMSRTYDDLCRQVFNETFDAAVGDITVTANRSKYVDFSLPIEDGGVTRTQKIEYDNPNDQWFFLKPLEKELWLTAIALFVFTGVSLWILEHRINDAFRGPPAEHAGLIFYIPFVSLVLTNGERIVSNLGRIVIVVFLFVVLILNSTYTANLSATLTTWKLQKADTDVTVLIKNGDYVGCREGSFIVSYLKRLGFDEKKIMTYKHPEQFDEALSNGSTNGGITAFFSCVPYTNLFLNKFCNRYMNVGSPYLTEGYAFAFPKGSLLVADVSRAIIELTDNGRISEIKDRWIKQSACNYEEPNPSDVAWKSISLKSFGVLFGITAGITAICLVLFFASYLYQHRDYIQSIFSSGTTTFSKIRAMCIHFDQRDTKFVRANSLMNPNGYPAHPSAVVPVSSNNMPGEDGGVGSNSDSSTATATAEQLRSV
ncbi:hypothetical protein C2S52_003778 [Perilla frutescens var. hirtella]|nr:hypothetical protein C2S52_003778 [Perilla frutescens var. hirtella]